MLIVAKVGEFHDKLINLDKENSLHTSGNVIATNDRVIKKFRTPEEAQAAFEKIIEAYENGAKVVRI